MTEIDLKEAELQAKAMKANELAEKVTLDMGANLDKSVAKWEKQGKTRFWIVKKIAQIAKPLARLRRRQDILIIIKGIEESCDRKDEEGTQAGINLLTKMTRNEVRMPIELAKITTNEWARKWRRKAGKPFADDKEGWELKQKADEEKAKAEKKEG